MTTSYLNPGGTGDRTASISGTNTIPKGGTGTVSNLVDGLIQGTNWWWTTGAASGALTFDFGAGASKIIDEVTYIQSNATTHGTYQWSGSNDNTNWTNIGGTFVLGAGGISVQVITTLSGNTTGYRYYRMAAVSGNNNQSPWVMEFEFKIDNSPVRRRRLLITGAYR